MKKNPMLTLVVCAVSCSLAVHVAQAQTNSAAPAGAPPGGLEAADAAVLEVAGLAVLVAEDAADRPPRGLRRDMTTIRT